MLLAKKALVNYLILKFHAIFMKSINIYATILGICVCFHAIGQQAPIHATAPTKDRNFTLIREFKTPGVTALNLSQSRSVKEESHSIIYTDNWGRPTQEILVKGSSNFKDITQIHEYNDVNGKDIEYLPYVEQNKSTGAFNINPNIELYNYYGDQSWDGHSIRTTHPFMKVITDGSISERVIEQGEIGSAWQPSTGLAKTTKFDQKYNNNIAFSDLNNSRKVKRFSVSQSGALEDLGYYQDNKLIVDIVKNVNWKATDGRLNTQESYSDLDGKEILTRTFVRNASGQLIMQSNYYVYSSVGELCFVLPSTLNADTQLPSTASIDKYGISYKYDNRGRKIEEKQPGIAPIYYVYNANDLVVASQTPNQRSKNQWTFTKYDLAGRIVQSGIINSSANRETLQNTVNGVATLYENTLSTGNGYTNNAWPTSGIAHYSVINYYDNYDYIPSLSTTLNYVVFNNLNKVDFPSGALTASKTYTTNNQELWTVTYYNQRGEVIQTQSTNHLGGSDLVNNYYNFAGELVQVERKHFDNNKAQKLLVKNTNEYDHSGRLLKVKQKINTQDEITLAAFSYNELGQLVDKKLHQKAGQSKYLQSIDYRYNERGWIASINDPNLSINTSHNDTDSDAGADLFGMQLSYADHPTNPQYNGNIAEFNWKTSKVASQSIAPPKMGYEYRYDDMNRLSTAISKKNGSIDNAHNETISYDVNGNILSLNRKAQINNAIHTIDDLAYTYDGYRTQKIDDVSTSTQKSLGYQDKANVATEHIYDANGNMIEDKSKNIKIDYDDRNLIKKITFAGVSTHHIAFLYDRTGKKLQAKYTNGTQVYTIDYLDGIQYQQNQIAFIHTGEGRARLNGSTYTYEYDIADHLGNVHVTFRPKSGDATQTIAEVLQQNSYYTYGMPMYGDPANGLHLSYVNGEKSKYLYSGKELYDQGGLNWFDHGSRMYDPAIGRWMAMDPAMQFVNPYLAMGNNPVIGVDPNGEFWHIVIGAAIGGVINLTSKALNGQIKSVGDGFAAFGIGAVAGGLTAATGGAVAGSFGLATTSFAGAAVAGASGAVYGDMALGIGNMGYFGDPYNPSLKRMAIVATSGAALGGIFQGLSNSLTGKNFWTGNNKIQVGSLIEESFGDIKIENFKLIKNQLGDIRDGKLLGEIIDNKFIMQGKTHADGFFDFVVTKEGRMLLGRSHSFLSQGEDVFAAGVMKVRNGAIVGVNNASGHYMPNISVSRSFPNIFKSLGIDISKTHFQFIDANGNKLLHILPQ